MTTFTLTGTCYDIRKNIVASAKVHIFDTNTDSILHSVTADAGGVYISSNLSIAGPLYCVAYHANSPDIAGTTLNTLMATANPVAVAGETFYILGF